MWIRVSSGGKPSMVQINILQPAEEKNHEWIIILQPADSRRTGTEQCLRFKSAPYARHS